MKYATQFYQKVLYVALLQVLPVLLVLAQYVSSAISSPPVDPNADNANTQKAIFA